MKTINITEYVQNARFGAFHLRLAIVGFLLIIFDGYDVAVYGAITPSLMADWNLPPVEAGAIGSAGLVGMLIGAVTFGTLADRLGRRRVVLATVLLYSVFTALCGFAQEPTFFTVCRFIAGLGLGGVMPNVIALLTDFSPKKHTATIVTIVLTGFAVGGLMAPVLGILVIPTVGWQASLWIAAVLLPLLPLIYRVVPESLSVLMRKGRTDDVRAVLQRIDPASDIDSDTEFELTAPTAAKLPLADLFTNQRATSTLMFWLAFFANLLVAYGFLNWLPKLMMDSGFNLTSSLVFLGVFQVGGILGTLAAGRLADRLGAKPVILGLYLLGVVVIAGVGLGISVGVTYVLIFVAGATLTGVQNLVQVYVAQYYPPFVRSTALGSASGVGRMGGILGPVIGGVLLSLAFSNQAIFFIFAIPGLVAAFAISMVRDNRSYQKELDQLSDETVAV